MPGTVRGNLRFTHPHASAARIAQVLERLGLIEKIAALPDGLDTKLSDTNVSGA